MATKPQFSLQMIFIAIAIAALVAAEAVAFPGWLAIVLGVVASSVLPPALVAGIVYGRDFGRAFCIGAVSWLLAAHCVAHWSFGVAVGMPGNGTRITALLIPFNLSNLEGLGFFRYDYCVQWSLTCVGGFLAVFVRWLTLNKSPDELQ